jgi:hypothetical protein
MARLVAPTLMIWMKMLDRLLMVPPVNSYRLTIPSLERTLRYQITLMDLESQKRKAHG